jgi:hypothetical protein
MTTRPFLRVLSALLLAGLFAGAVPASPAEAYRPVCRTSKTVRIPVEYLKDPTLKGKGCVDNGVLSVELQQRYINLMADHDLSSSFFKVKVHSTTSKGRYLNQIVFIDEIWLGDLSELFNSGASNKYGNITYKRSAKLPEVRLPELPAGVYQVSFEVSTRLDPEFSYNRAKIPDGVASTGPVYIKVKV